MPNEIDQTLYARGGVRKEQYLAASTVQAFLLFFFQNTVQAFTSLILFLHPKYNICTSLCILICMHYLSLYILYSLNTLALPKFRQMQTQKYCQTESQENFTRAAARALYSYVFIKLRPEPRGLSSLLDVLYFKEKRFDYKIKLFCILNGQSKHGPWLGEG